MKFTESWLRQYCNPPLSTEALAECLTMGGLEVEETTVAAPAFSGVVVGEILQLEKHPDADRLNVCRVNVGAAEPLQIVCGAPNVAIGLKVPCATAGALLPGNFAIKPTKMRGVESQGMLCSAKELGVNDESAGLWVLPADSVPGANVRDVMALDDTIFLLKLTPNRADCFGVTGIARDLAALANAPLHLPHINAIAPTILDRLPVAVDPSAHNLCGRFSGRIIRGVNAQATTPLWLKTAIERAGMRAISPLVDISNYVMLEQNRPTHIFDIDKLPAGGLKVRWARANESLTLLNEQTVTLNEHVGIIANALDEPEAMAGIMGGNAVAVSATTQNVYVEAAFWWPEAIAGRARSFNFSSEASHRFERGTDFATTQEGVERVTELILAICGGEAGPLDDQILSLPKRDPISMRVERAEKIIGIPVDGQMAASIFKRLHLPYKVDYQADAEVFKVTPPSFRFDLNIEEDLIEEVARIHGFDNIPIAPPRAAQSFLPVPRSLLGRHLLRHQVAALGYHEIISMSFTDAAWERDFTNTTAPIRLQNPIASQMSVMRSSLIGGLIQTLQRNIAHRAERVRLFELGRVFLRDASVQDSLTTVANYAQPIRLGGLSWGSTAEAQWGEVGRPVDFYDMKGDIEALFHPQTLVFKACRHPALHPGRAADIALAGKTIGWLGELHPRWVKNYDLVKAPMVFELDFEALNERPDIHVTEVAKVPPVKRDLALVVAEHCDAMVVMQTLQRSQAPHVKEIVLFDVYRGSGVEKAYKSLAFSITLQHPTATLTDDEIEQSIKILTDAAHTQLGAELR